MIGREESQGGTVHLGIVKGGWEGGVPQGGRVGSHRPLPLLTLLAHVLEYGPSSSDKEAHNSDDVKRREMHVFFFCPDNGPREVDGRQPEALLREVVQSLNSLVLGDALQCGACQNDPSWVIMFQSLEGASLGRTTLPFLGGEVTLVVPFRWR